MAALGLIATPQAWALVTLVRLLATLAESVIGATLQQRLPWLSNELVNGLQTLLAALLAMASAAAPGGGCWPWATPQPMHGPNQSNEAIHTCQPKPQDQPQPR
jgi:hypothetical protein